MNSADQSQVKEAERKNRDKRKQQVLDLKEILSTEAGKRFMWRLVGKSNVFSSVWENSAKIHYNAGQQDFGHFLMSEWMEADSESFIQMMKKANEEGVPNV